MLLRTLPAASAPTLRWSVRRVTIGGAVPGQRSQRNPESELQLEVVEVLHPVRREREHQAPQHRGGGTSGEVTHQRICRHAACHESGKQREVVDEQGTDAQPVQRRDGEGRSEHRVGVGERRGLGKEDVRVEQPARIVANLVGDPGQPPDGEERVAVLANRRVGRQNQRVRVGACQQREEAGHQQWLGESTRMSQFSGPHGSFERSLRRTFNDSVAALQAGRFRIRHNR